MIDFLSVPYAHPESLLGFTQNELPESATARAREGYVYEATLTAAQAGAVGAISVAGTSYPLGRNHDLTTPAGRQGFVEDATRVLGFDAKLRVKPTGIACVELDSGDFKVFTGHSAVPFDFVGSASTPFNATAGKREGGLDRGVPAFTVDREVAGSNVESTVEGPYVEAATLVDGVPGTYVPLTDEPSRSFTTAVPQTAGAHAVGVRVRARVRQADGSTRVEEFDRVVTVTV